MGEACTGVRMSQSTCDKKRFSASPSSEKVPLAWEVTVSLEMS